MSLVPPQTVTSRKIRVAQILVAVPGILILSLALHGIVADYQHIGDVKRRLAARTALAKGTIVELHDAWHGGRKIPKETVVFTTASGEQVRFLGLANANDKVGMEMPVRYDPRQPANFAVGNDFFGFSDLVFGNAPFFAMGLYFLLMAVLLGRRRA